MALLQACWELSGGICGKRLAPFLPDLLAQLAVCEALPAEATPEMVARVAAMSAATVDRLLAPVREGWPRRGLGTTKPGTLHKAQGPIRTLAEWDEATPGFLELNLVAHCGPNGSGEVLFTLSTVDVATGWMGCIGVPNRSQEAVFAALGRLRAALPFPLLGLDCDKGSAFINRNLVQYCCPEGITLPRSRPYRKHDPCFIGPKNGRVGRRLVGYARFERHALPALNHRYVLANAYVHFLQPVRKLLDKTRDGAKVHQRYDPARTPYRRLLESQLPSPQTTAPLAERDTALHPVRLKLELETAQPALYRHAIRSDPSMRHR